MIEYSNAEITETRDMGVVLLCKSVEIADSLEDFLTEQCFVFFNIKPQDETVSFYFGQASSLDKVCALYERFLVDTKQ
jgi:hypothetical protein